MARVVIGMLDPDDRISGRGQRALRRAGIATTLFDDDLMTEIEELNRDFIREREAAASAAPPAAPEALREKKLEELVIGFLKKTHPNTGYDYEEVSTGTDLTKRDATRTARPSLVHEANGTKGR